MRTIMTTALAGALFMASNAQAAPPVRQWLTTADRSQALQRQAKPPVFTGGQTVLPTITVNDRRTFQTMQGFGYAVTGGSAQLIMAMSPAARQRLLLEIFGQGEGRLDVASIRISIGASDLDDHVFSYDDRPAGETDPTLAHFDLAPDRRALIPLLREILAIRPDIHILASPWSPPLWMKTNGLPKAGSLKPEAYDAFARYLVRYIQGMHEAGIPVEAITLQNEPRYLKNTPSMSITAAEQTRLIGDHVGPAFRTAGLATRILAYDHNPDDIGYAMTVLADPKAAPFVHGTAFHLYEGPASAISTVHAAHPGKHLFLTEMWVTDDVVTGSPIAIAAPISRIMAASIRNWVEGVILWNLAADPHFGPHTSDGGCTECEGAITLDGDKVTRNAAYYTLAHISSFVPPGSRRIESIDPDSDFTSVAFRTPDGHTVLVVGNQGMWARDFAVAVDGKSFATRLPQGAAATYIW